MYSYAKPEQKKVMKNTVQKKKTANTHVMQRADDIRCPSVVFAQPMTVRQSNIAMPNQEVIQRKIIIGDQELILKNEQRQDMLSRIEVYITTNDIPKDFKKERFLAMLKTMAKDEAEYSYINMNELFDEAYSRMQTQSQRKVVNPVLGNAQAFFDYIKNNMPTIIEMKPQEFKELMGRRLGVAEAEINQEYNSPKGSIPGTVVYTYQKACGMKIEIHPKGGIHYGAYLLVEFYDGSTKKEWKWVSSKRSTYLPCGENREHTFPKEEFYDIMKGVSSSQREHPQKGRDTTAAILQVPIKKIFSKKGMVESGIWSYQTKESVGAYRDKIRNSRLEKLSSVPASGVKAATIGLESAKITRRLATLRLEIARMGFTGDAERCKAILEECQRIRQSMEKLNTMIDSEPDPEEKSRLEWYVSYNESALISVEKLVRLIITK